MTTSFVTEEEKRALHNYPYKEDFQQPYSIVMLLRSIFVWELLCCKSNQAVELYSKVCLSCFGRIQKHTALVGSFTDQIPDLPPINGCIGVNNNSILNWARQTFRL